MAPLSEQARRVVEGLLAGHSLDSMAPSGSAVRAEVEQHLIDTLGSDNSPVTGKKPRSRGGSAADSPRKRARAARKAGPADPPRLPGRGIALAFCDGASRGNPGPAAIGVRILAADGAELLAEGVTIGRATNNVAEYRGVIHVLERAASLGLDALEIRMDSELVVKQLNGEYRVKQPALAELKEQVDRLRPGFRILRVKHVRREGNREADELANEALDRA